MALRVWERQGSGAGTQGKDSKTREKLFGVMGTENEDLVTAIVQAYAPYNIGPLQQNNISRTPKAPGLWDVTVSYEKPQSQDPGQLTWSFDTGGGTQHISQSIQTVGKYKIAGAGEFPKTNGAIGVTKDSIEGVDVQVPQWTWQETAVFDAAQITDGYVDALFRTTACTNRSPWRKYKTGEALFLGSSGAPKEEDEVEITFHFGGSPNRTGLSVGEITGIAKKGWEYLWIIYQEGEHNGCFVKTPTFCFVEQVYYDADFAALGIGN